jgi:para-aminobenzoate synthetase/4-amino-4-deoxychorismate lyase
MRGDPARGIFETVLVVNGRAQHWDRHERRLRASARELYGVEPDEIPLGAAAGLALGRMRVDAVPREGRLAVAVRCEQVDPAIVAPDAQVRVATVSVEEGFGPHKLIDRRWLEAIERSVPEGARALLAAPGGELLETTRANVLVVRDGTLETPALDGRILPGVVRELALERAREAGIAVREGPVTASGADALLLTGSVRLIEWCTLRAAAAPEVAEILDTLRKALVQ